MHRIILANLQKRVARNTPAPGKKDKRGDAKKSKQNKSEVCIKLHSQRVFDLQIGIDAIFMPKSFRKLVVREASGLQRFNVLHEQ